MYLIDTSIWIDVLRHRDAQLVARLRSLTPAQIRACSVVRAELLHGAERSSAPAANVELVVRLLAPFRSVGFDDACAKHYARARADLEAHGAMIGANDLLIAAIALRHGATVVTRNGREFARVDGLRVEAW